MMCSVGCRVGIYLAAVGEAGRGVHPVAYFDAVFLVSVVMGIFFIFRRGEADFRRSTKFLLAGLLFFMGIYAFCMGMEWSGITKSLETVEDLVGALVPMWWAFVFYGFMHEISDHDILAGEAKYRSLVSNIPDVIWTADEHGRITFVSSNVESVYLFSAEDICSKGVDFLLERVHPGEYEAVKDAFGAMFSDDIPLDIEYRTKRKDGEWIWLHLRSLGAYSRGGVKYADGVFSDITERKRSLEDLERIFNLSGYMVCVADMKGYFQKISPTFEDVLGYSSKELLSRPYIDFVHPSDRAKTVTLVEDQLSSGIDAIGFENRYRCKDGRYKWLHWSSHPVIEEGIIFAIAHDITDRKVVEEEIRAANRQLAASEQELRESRHLLGATINNSPAVIYVKDLEGRYLLVNKSYEKMLGRSSEEMLGQSDEAFFPKEVAAQFRANDLLALESDSSMEFEEMALHASGKMHTYMSTKFALHNKDGAAYAICGISVDITQRKRVEDAVERIVWQGASSLGQEFLDGMARQLCGVLGADFSLIGETVGDGHNRIKTRSVCFEGEIQENFEYDLAGTPCGDVFGQKPCSYPKDVCRKFPEDELLREMGIEGYVGAPLFGSKGEAIGIMAALFRDEIENVEFAESILELFAGRTVGEIIRMDAEAAVKERLAFETLIAGLSGKFVNLPSDLVDKEIKEGIRQIVEFLGVDRGGILEFSEDQTELHTTHVYAAAGIEPVPTVDVADRFPWLTDQLRRGETICLFRPEDLPEEAESERQFIREEGYKAFLMTPLKVGGSIIGALTVGVLEGERSWSDETILRLELVGGIFGNALMRMRTENALRDSEERYRAVVEDQTELICRNLPDSTLTFVNDAYCRYFGKGREDLIGKKFVPAIPDEDRQKVVDCFSQLNRENPVATHEHRVIMPDGEIRWHQWTNRAIFDEDGNIFEFQGVGRDITERKRLEDKERRHHEQLVHFSRLTVAGELASGMAHELNQPLTAITTYAQACQRLIDSGRFDSAKLREASGEIAAQAMRGGEIIRRMRTFVRKQNPQRVSIDFNEIVREAIGLVRMQAKSIGVTLHIKLCKKPLTVFADKIQIQQVLVNLFQNGFDAMSEVATCDRALTIRTSRTSEDTVEIAVEDKGVGLPKDESNKIFESFFTTKSDGLGIGLSMSRSIIEEHGGHIWAEPNVESGAVFKVSLPLGKK